MTINAQLITAPLPGATNANGVCPHCRVIGSHRTACEFYSPPQVDPLLPPAPPVAAPPPAGYRRCPEHGLLIPPGQRCAGRTHSVACVETAPPDDADPMKSPEIPVI